MEPTVVELIARKRDGGALTSGEIARIIRDSLVGTIADYQLSALLMAVFFRGLDDAETVALTEAMLHSGSVLSLPAVKGVKVDTPAGPWKHTSPAWRSNARCSAVASL